MTQLNTAPRIGLINPISGVNYLFLKNYSFRFGEGEMLQTFIAEAVFTSI